MKKVLVKLIVVAWGFGGSLSIVAEEKKEPYETIFPLVTLNAKIVDEEGAPVPDAFILAHDTTSVKMRPIARMESRTDPYGEATLTFRAFITVALSCKKEPWYDSDTCLQTPTPFIVEKGVVLDPGQRPPMKKKIQFKGGLVMRKKIEPTPLHVKKVSFSFPARGVWLGYDLEIGDWLPPYGKGQRGDLKFRSLSHQLVDLDKRPDVTNMGIRQGNVGILEVDFGNDGGSVFVDENNGYLKESLMKLPHLAPLEGYGQSIFKKEVVFDTRENSNLNCGRFFRIRVEKQGEQVVKANYGKLIGDLVYNAREYERRNGPDERKMVYGNLQMTFYFNPTPNDRNLEFDPDKNLIQHHPNRSKFKP